MAASRKLQGDIDRCLKKVAEGVEQFEDIWKKVHNATNSNQKEKYEADLKKEIKKLQRLRDQIKSWLQSGEIKDKTQLLENRKLIETQMERFKVVERETKTKAYSKEGLGAAQNKDPAQRERDETNRWLSECIDMLNLQLDQFESEIESLLAACKKKKIDKDKSDRVEGLRHSLERHRFHIGKLEVLMRMLNNESINCDQIKKIKEDIEYYIESSQDPDFFENEGVYDDIVMDDLDYTAPDISHLSHDSTEGSTSSSVCGSSPAPSPAVIAVTANHSNTNDNHGSGMDSSTGHLNNNSSSASSSSSVPVPVSVSVSAVYHADRKRSSKSEESSVKSGSTPVKPQVVRPSHGGSTSNSTSTTISSSSFSTSSHSSTNSGSGSGSGSGSKATPPLSSSTPTKPVSGSTSLSTPNNSSSSSGLTNHVSSQHNRDSIHSLNSTSGSGSGSGSVSTAHNSIASLSSLSSSISFSLSNGPIGGVHTNSVTTTTGSLIPSSVPLLTNNNSVSSYASSVNFLTGSSNKIESGVSLKEMAQKKLNEVSSTSSTSIGSDNLGSSLANNTAGIDSTTTSLNNNNTSNSQQNSILSSSTTTTSKDSPATSVVATTEAHIPPLLGVAPLGSVHLTPEHKTQFERLQAGFYHMPHPSDSERFRLHFPRQPIQTPAYYPQVPFPLSDTVDFFQRLSTETLFFIFYYMEGTKAQYLAAKALKKQSWRFHTKYMMWFQRHEEPKAITDEFEQGTYIFFDYENWGQRKRENFVFEYRFLEDRELN